jgi:TatD DNase family protein
MYNNSPRQYELIDFHCHLDLFPNHLQLLKECEQIGIKTLTVTNAPRVWRQNQLFAKDCQHIRVGLGLHPQLAHAYANELNLFEQYLPEAKYIGEVGLDGGTEYENTLEKQRQVFRTILDLCAQSGGKILSIHSRHAAREVIDLIGNIIPPSKGKTVLHWFTGSIKDALVAVEAGCYFSVNIKMLTSPQKIRLIERLPQDKILTESDGPFIKMGKSLMSPKDIGKVVEKIARLWSVDEASAALIIRNNLKNLVSTVSVRG